MLPTTQPSPTALMAAAARAAHLIVDDAPVIFADTLAATLLGEHAETLLAYHRDHGDHPVLAAARTEVTCRSRYTEDRLAEAASHGVHQYVILGAGLDTFGHRSELAGSIPVFEVDHPATQQWKRRRLADAGLAKPDRVSHVAVDFEAESMSEALRGAGFDMSIPTVVSWLGVTMYLSRPAIERTLSEIATFAPGSELIADYLLPAELRDTAAQTYVDLVEPTTAERGEPWLSYLEPAEFTTLLTAHRFGDVTHVTQRDSIKPELWKRADSLRPADLSRIAHATLA